MWHFISIKPERRVYKWYIIPKIKSLHVENIKLATWERGRQRRRENGVLCPCMHGYCLYMPRHFDAIFTSSLTSASSIQICLQSTAIRNVEFNCFRYRILHVHNAMFQISLSRHTILTPFSHRLWLPHPRSKSVYSRPQLETSNLIVSDIEFCMYIMQCLK
jgi:hypothetical protein